MEQNRKISPIIYGAIDKLKKCFGGTKIELLSEEMYRQPPSEFCPLGYLGVDIKVEGIKVFLGCESMAEDIACTPYGQSIADDFVFRVIKEGYPELFNTPILK
jgi:hypothetical protein